MRDQILYIVFMLGRARYILYPDPAFVKRFFVKIKPDFCNIRKSAKSAAVMKDPEEKILPDQRSVLQFPDRFDQCIRLLVGRSPAGAEP